MSLLQTLSRAASGFREARMRYLTERSIGALSPEIQKDIGWPDAYRLQRGARSPARKRAP